MQNTHAGPYVTIADENGTQLSEVALISILDYYLENRAFGNMNQAEYVTCVAGAYKALEEGRLNGKTCPECWLVGIQHFRFIAKKHPHGLNIPTPRQAQNIVKSMK